MKLVLSVEYNGNAYFGWQRQKKLPSIQEHIEQALSKVANEPIKIFCAGRTDAGVHAFGQIVHFETNIYRTNAAWIIGTNTNLPNNIVIRWITQVVDDFHARFSAIARRYCYIINNNNIRSALFNHTVTHYSKPLNIQEMILAAKCLLGKHDFTSFSGSKYQSQTNLREIYHLIITRQNDYIIFDIKANAFVYHMVRNIVGSLIKIGCGSAPISWIADLIVKRDRSLAGITAPAKGLYLMEVYYPQRFILPILPKKPFFLIV